MPKETAEEFANRILKGMGFDLDLIGDAPGHVAADIRARDREVTEEMRERAADEADGAQREAKWFKEETRTPQEIYNQAVCEVADYIRALPIDPPAEDKVCLTCGGKHRMVAPCPDCHGTGRQRAQGKRKE